MRTTCDFMQAIGYHGILDIGYRRDQRDGSYKVLDVNPRIGCTFRLFAASEWPGRRSRIVSGSDRPASPSATPARRP